MICSLSGEPTLEPVLSLKSHRIFDKKLLRNFIEVNQKDPITDEEMTEHDVVPVEVTIPSHGVPSSTKTSIPSMLSAFQQEWDALALELFTLRKQLAAAREELSMALYHQDAAVRVAARAVKEKTEAQNALRDLAANFSTNGVEAVQQNTSPTKMPELYSDMLIEANQALFSEHKAFKPKSSLLPSQPVELQKRETQTCDSLSTVKLWSYSKELNCALVYSNETVDLVSISDYQVKKSYNVSQVTALGFVGTEPVIGCSNTLSFSFTESEDSAHIHFDKDIVTLLSHDYLKMIVVVLLDSYCIIDTKSREKIFQSEPLASSLSCGDLHPDGLLLGVGVESGVSIYDISKGSQVAEFTTSATPSNVKFASNGYWMLVTYGETLEIFDLRKSVSIFSKTFSTSVAHVAIDRTSAFVFVSTTGKLTCLRYMKKGKKFSDESIECDISGGLSAMEIIPSETGKDEEVVAVSSEVSKLQLVGL